MKTLQLLLLLFGFAILGCRSQVACSLIWIPDFGGEGIASELTTIKTVGIMDTSVAAVNINTTIMMKGGREITENKGIGVNILIKKPGKEDYKIGGIADQNGNYHTYLETGIYDIEFMYSFFNTLHIENISFQSGELKKLNVKLGIRGAEEKLFIVDLEEKTLLDK